MAESALHRQAVTIYRGSAPVVPVTGPAAAVYDGDAEWAVTIGTDPNGSDPTYTLTAGDGLTVTSPEDGPDDWHLTSEQTAALTASAALGAGRKWYWALWQTNAGQRPDKLAGGELVVLGGLAPASLL